MSSRVLIIDTDRSCVELLSAILARNGFEVLVASGDAQAFDQINQHSFDLVICGEQVGNIPGLELCQKIKLGQPKFRVVLLGNPVELQRQPSDPDGVVPLPFRFANLKKLLGSWQISFGPNINPDPVSFAVPMLDPLKMELPAAPPVPGETDPLDLASASKPLQHIDNPDDPATLPIPIPLPFAQNEGPLSSELLELNLEDLSLAEDQTATPASESFSHLNEPTSSLSNTDPQTALTGNFETTPLPRLLYQLYVQTFSGAIHIQSAAAQRTIYLQGGLPVRVDSKQLSESLGRVLLDHGRITPAQYEQSLEIMQAKNCRHGEALIELGAIRVMDLLDALQEQTELKLVSTFAWRTADYKIESQIDFANNSILSEVHPLKAIWRGVCEHYDLESLLKFFLTVQEKWIVGTELFPIHYHTLGIFLRELDIAKFLDGNTTFGKALQTSSKTLETAQALYVLLVTDMVRPSLKPGLGVSLPAENLSVQPAILSESDTILANTIAAEYLRIKESDPWDALCVELSASRDEVAAAFINISKSLHLGNFPPNLPEGSRRRGREIRQVLIRARNILSTKALLDSYLQEQAQQKLPDIKTTESDSADINPQHSSLNLQVDAKERASINIQAIRYHAEGQALLAADKADEAIKQFQLAVSTQPDEPSFFVSLGKAFWRAAADKGETTRAKVVTCLDQALQLDPGHPEANLEMARLLATTGNKKRARVYAQRVLQRSPESSDARRILEMLG